jgi:hypothetical protein
LFDNWSSRSCIACPTNRYLFLSYSGCLWNLVAN